MIENFKIRSGMLLVSPTEAKEQKTASGLFIPTSAAKEPNNGKLVKLGTVLMNDHDMKPGDLVFYGDRTGQEITLFGVKYRLLQSKEAMGWIPKEYLERILN